MFRFRDFGTFVLGLNLAFFEEPNVPFSKKWNISFWFVSTSFYFNVSKLLISLEFFILGVKCRVMFSFVLLMFRFCENAKSLIYKEFLGVMFHMCRMYRDFEQRAWGGTFKRKKEQSKMHRGLRIKFTPRACFFKNDYI